MAKWLSAALNGGIVMERHWVRAVLTCACVAGVLITSSCSDRRDPVSPNAVAGQSSRPASWNEASDEAIWAQAARTDTSIRIGLKSVGKMRGVVRGRPDLSAAEWSGAVEALSHQPGVRVISVDSLLPMVVVMLESQATLAKVRKLPYIDYVEPRRLPASIAGVGGCSQVGYNGPLVSINLPGGGGDWIGPGYDRMNIINAWNITDGASALIGLSDTGLDTEGGDYETASEFSPQFFASGMSSGRTLEEYNGASQCGHGTRVAGLIAAPRNGRSMMGVAYHASLISSRHGDGVWLDGNVDGWDAFWSVRTLLLAGASTVSMAWGMTNASGAVSDEIDRGFYTQDVAFVGAAGTCGVVGGYCGNSETAVFPASKMEVYAATGANYDDEGSRPGNVYDFGEGKAGSLSYTNLPTTGRQYGRYLTPIEGSSGATGIITGVMALVRSHNPWMSAQMVYDRMYNANHCSFNRVWKGGYLVNASAAVGGPCVVNMSGVFSYFIDDPYNPGFHEKDFSTVIITTGQNGYQYAGSGSYTITWELGAGAVASSTDDSGPYTTPYSATGYRTIRHISFLPHPQGYAYYVPIKVHIADNVLGTDDVREMVVNVCQNMDNGPCYAAVPYPGEYQPNPTAIITGTERMEPGASCGWIGGSYDVPDPVSYRWLVNGNQVSTADRIEYSSQSGFDLELQVSGGGRSASTSMWVDVYEGAGDCGWSKKGKVLTPNRAVRAPNVTRLVSKVTLPAGASRQR